VTYAKGLVGTRGVHMKAAKPGCVCKRSLVRVFLSIMKILSAEKCKHPQRVAIQPSRKLYATRGTRVPSKCVSQSGGNCPKINLIELMKEDLR